MQVNVFHREHLSVAAAGSASFDAEYRSKRRLRNVTTARVPTRQSPIANPIEVVVFPSPNGVGLMAVTKMYSASGLSFSRSSAWRATFPCIVRMDAVRPGRDPSRLAMSWMGRGWYASRDLKIAHGFGEMEGEASA